MKNSVFYTILNSTNIKAKEITQKLEKAKALCETNERICQRVKILPLVAG
jgi:hypothetical protein